MDSVKESSISGAKYGFIEKLSVQGVRFVLGLVMARLLSPDDYGTVSMIMVFISILEICVDGGFTNALIRKKEHTEADFSTAFFFNLIISIVCYAILFFAAPYIALFYKNPILTAVLRVQSLVLVINALSAVQVARLNISLNFKAIATYNIISSVVSGIAGVVLAYLGFGVWALVIQSLIAWTANLVYVYIQSKWLPKLLFSISSFKEMFGYGSRLLLSNVINRIYQNLYTLVIGKFYSAKDLGVYGRGSSLAAFPANMVGGVFQKITFPILAKLQDDDNRLLAVAKKYIMMLSAIVFFFCILLASLAKPLVLILLSSKWEASIIFLQIFTFSVILNHIDVINLNCLFVKGRSDLVLRLEVIKKIIATLLLAASIPFGMVAICLSKVCFSIVTIIADSYYTGKFFNYGFKKQLKDILPFLFFSIISCLPGFMMSLTSINSWLVLVSGGISALTLYYLFLHKNPILKELFQLIKDYLPKYKI